MVKEKVLKKQYYSYIVPSIVSQIVYSAYVLVDGIFVARGVSETALAAVNIAAPFMTFLWAISLTFASGTSTVAARLLGQGKPEEASKVFSRNMSAMTVLGILISLIVGFAMEPFCNLLGAGPETMEYVQLYIGTIVPFSLFFLMSYTLEILTATDGYPKVATVTVSVGVVLNIVLDYLFIFVMDKGVWGAAVATAISQVIVIIIYLFHFCGPRATIRFCRFLKRETGENLKYNCREVFKGMGKGVPSGINEMAPGIITFIFVHSIQIYLGEREIVAYSAVNYIATLIIFIGVGLAQGSQPLLSFYNGRKDTDSINRLMKYQYKTVCILIIPTILLVMLLAKPAVMVFITSGAELIDYSVYALRIFVTACVFSGFNIVMSNYFTSMERPARGALVSIGRCCIMLIVGIYVAVTVLGPDGIWWGMPISEILTMAGAIIMYQRLNKEKVKNV